MFCAVIEQSGQWEEGMADSPEGAITTAYSKWQASLATTANV
jgi:hypothetical protein